MGANEITIQAAERAISEGHILHLRADRMPAQRGADKRDARPRADFTVGPAANGGFLVVDYSRILSGSEERFGTAAEAIREARKMLTWNRIAALRTALVTIFGDSEKATTLVADDARQMAMGARMRDAFGHRGSIVGSLFGPSGVGVERAARR